MLITSLIKYYFVNCFSYSSSRLTSAKILLYKRRRAKIYCKYSKKVFLQNHIPDDYPPDKQPSTPFAALPQPDNHRKTKKAEQQFALPTAGADPHQHRPNAPIIR
jgi:hypothetical protein